MNPDENLDPNLNGEIVETPAATPAETITPDAGSSVNQNGAVNLSPEEVSWNNLSGSAQDRFRETTRELARVRREREDLLARQQSVPENRFNALDNAPVPGAQDAVQTLDKIGMAPKQYVDQQINQQLSGLVYNMELERLGGRYDGSNGLPKFDREEYENYIAIHPQYRNYTPEDVYNKMYDSEIFDWRSQQNQGRTNNRNSNTTLRPNRTQVREEPLTPEMIEQRLQEPDGTAWYAANIDKVNAVIAKTGNN